MKKLYTSLTLIAAITLLAACVTQRKKEEAKGISLFFHNLQSKYNGYFNANELLRDATEKLEASHVDNFNKILDVYPALAVDNPQSAAPDLDKATEKVAVVATYHRPSHWVDDCYLLMGKAQYLKHDFESAEETFGYLTEVYNPSLKKKKTKKDREAAAKEKKEEREKAQKEKKKEREAKTKELQKIREETAKEKAKAKEDAAKQAAKDKEDRDAALKKIKADEEEARKNTQKNKKMSIDERNEARRKANEEAAAARKKARETKKTDKTTEPVVADKKTETPQYPNDKKTEIAKTDVPTDKKTDKNAEKAAADAKKKEEDDKKAIAAKAKGHPDNYFLRHRPCYQEGVVWYARTLTERQSYSDAELLLNKIDRDPKTFKDVRAMSATARAHLYLKQLNYDAAIPALENALSLSKKKKEKVRLAYILAQLYQLRGNNAQAFHMFDRVLNYNPSYEMEFNARLSVALNDDKSTSDQIASKLLKMGKDAKNAEYGGQIYFTLAQIALKKNDKPKAIEYLLSSLASPARNPQQKAEAYYLMATMNYEAENYVVAKAYYDSASTSFSDRDARKGTATLYAGNLLDIAKNIEIINLQDSLLRVSGMTDKEKREVAARAKKAQVVASQVKIGTPSVLGGKLSDIDMAELAKKSKFFGFDRDNVKRGKREFEKKWGTDRRLEDNWNRSARRSNGEFSRGNADDVVASDMTKKEVADLLKDVPKTTDEKNATELKIDEAYFQLGTLYHDKLKNDKKSIETLDKHQSRFPKTKHELEDWYYEYLAHTELKNTAKAKEYYDKIMGKYPDSMYGRMLKNSDDGKKKDEQTVESYYSVTYALFKDEKVKEAQDRIAASETLYGVNNPLKAKFALLYAMCTGRLKGREAYVASLKDVITKFKDTPEQKRAEEILRILEFGGPINEAPKPSAVDTTAQDDLSTRFVASDDKLHYVIVILNKNVDIEDAKIGVSDFNAKYFRTENLNISSIFLSTETEIGVLVVRKFKDKPTALIYTEGVEKNKKDFLKGEYSVFAVSQDNYREILRQKVVEHYQRFYDKNYRK